MVQLSPLETTGVLVALAFIPPIVFALWVRHQERHHREPFGGLARAFTWGAIGGVLIALVLQGLLGGPDVLVLAVVVAPFTEEFAKALGLRWVPDAHPEVEDGLVYGAAAGLGFAATENLVYQAATYLEDGLAASLAVGSLRIVTAALMHGSVTAIIGWAMWRRRVENVGFGVLVGAYVVAVILHAAYNAAVLTVPVVGFLFALLLAWGAAVWMVKRLRGLDRRTTRRGYGP